jgi:hypothetical protein
MKESIRTVRGNMSFHDALIALMNQRSISREAWVYGEWARLAVAHFEFDLPYQILRTPDTKKIDGGEVPLRFFTGQYEPHFYRRGADQKFRPWEPSAEDIMANDWELVDVSIID